METWLMLRGHVGDGWNADAMARIDMWSVLWHRVTEIAGVRGIVACHQREGFGGVYSADNYQITPMALDVMVQTAARSTVVFNRGGFPEFDAVCAQTRTGCLYYGAGARTEPTMPGLYTSVLHEDAWMKPSIDWQFKPMPEVEKQYDVCYIANAAQAGIKSIDWVYATCPRHLKVLHLCRGKCTIPQPENITTIESDKEHMPYFINLCKVGVVPYWSGYDSAPRALPEMQACGLPCMIGDTVRFGGKFNGARCGQDGFWSSVDWLLASSDCWDDVVCGTRDWYLEHSSLEVAAHRLFQIICEDVLCL